MNRLITRLILAFVSSSLALTLLPLLQWGGAPLIAVLDRSQSLVVYAAFLMLFAAFVLPRFLRGELAGRSRWPWLALVAWNGVSAPRGVGYVLAHGVLRSTSSSS